MPLTIPNLDTRKYQDILDEAIARIPVHTPEWTNFNEADPGVTILEIFAFLNENLLFVANQIPEKNHLKFLTLLGVPLQPAVAATGLVAFTNDNGPLDVITLPTNMEVLAGNVPFQTEMGLALLPIEAQIYTKQTATLSNEQQAYYNQLYASYGTTQDLSQLQAYDPVQFVANGQNIIDLSQTVDSAFWIALLARTGDDVVDARSAIAGGILSVGVVPQVNLSNGRILQPGTFSTTDSPLPLVFSAPIYNSNPPAYTALDATFSGNVLVTPGVIQITLPAASGLQGWDNLGPLDVGVGDYPPAIDDSNVASRVITWLRVTNPTQASVQLIFAGINTTNVTQRAHVSGELLPGGTGEPDQSVTLANPSSIANSVQLNITTTDGTTDTWLAIDDIASAPPEVVVQNSGSPPGTITPPPGSPNVFMPDYESGVLTFGDGTHGRRPPYGAVIRATYDYCQGTAGNIGVGAINSAPALPAGVSVTNPVRTWGGVDAQTATEAEKEIPTYLQHRDRLVTADDFQNVTMQTPGVDLARVEVVPAYNPQLGSVQPGDSPGSVTLMVVPWADLVHPDTPDPTSDTINAICNYLDPRRLVTTEVIVRGPNYIGIWISVGIQVVSGFSEADVIAAVKSYISQALSSLPPDPEIDPTDAPARPLDVPDGWELGKNVVAAELLAFANRVEGVLLVQGDVLLVSDDGQQSGTVSMNGLDLPRIYGISVAIGAAVAIATLQQGTVNTPSSGLPTIPIPVAPDEC